MSTKTPFYVKVVPVALFLTIVAVTIAGVLLLQDISFKNGYKIGKSVAQNDYEKHIASLQGQVKLLKEQNMQLGINYSEMADAIQLEADIEINTLRQQVECFQNGKSSCT